jgi:2-phospho-L-lactate transferase/gluconeogenesis factor (CofD/UPF0052 family)
MIDKVIVNSHEIPKEILDRYREEGSTPVVLDRERVKKMGVKILDSPLIKIDSEQRIRHLSHKLAAMIYSEIDNLENFYEE